MTNEELSQLEEAAMRATQGEWKFWTSNSWRRLIASVLGDHKPVIMPFTARHDKQPDMSIRQEDMDYIEAAQPANVMSLIQEVKRLRMALDEFGTHEDACVKWQDWRRECNCGLDAALIAK